MPDSLRALIAKVLPCMTPREDIATVRCMPLTPTERAWLMRAAIARQDRLARALVRAHAWRQRAMRQGPAVWRAYWSR